MMKNQKLWKKTIKNEKGFLTLDFIFAIILMFSFSAILFMFTITFSAVEIAQYAVFSSSRAYFGAAKNPKAQEQAARDKFNELVLAPRSPLGNIFRNGWFKLEEVQIDDFNGDFSNDPDNDSATFIGARTTITANILQFRFPLLGGNTEELKASPASYLMREPSEEECVDFSAERFARIQSLSNGFSQSYVNPAAYAVIMDDGC